jgi:hypothetical protein
MTTNETTISAESNPALANKLVEEALSGAQEETVQPIKAEVPLPPETQVSLPGGISDPLLGLIDSAEIRELNGADEEAVSKITDTGKALMLILDRAVVSLGGEKPSKELMDNMLAGDREMLLLAIRKATFGSDIELGPGACPFCGTEQVYEIDLNKDVKIRTLSQEDRIFTVACKVGAVKLRLPSGHTQKSIVNSTDKTSAEIDSIILNGCIISINDQSIFGMDEVRKLSVSDRRTLLSEIASRNPGPQLSSIEKTCQSCNEEVPLPLTLADLFR